MKKTVSNSGTISITNPEIDRDYLHYGAK